MKTFIKGFLPYFCFIILIFSTFSSSAENKANAEICSQVLRFHVLASSDSANDQAIKLRVRDAIYPMLNEIFGSCTSIDEALRLAEENRDNLVNRANKVLDECGRQDRATLIVGKEAYPEKVYGTLVFPAGEYLSARLIIGDGRGQNWWCVMFPPLLGAGVEEYPEILQDGGMKKSQIEKMKKGGITLFGTTVKLKFLEYFR